MSSLSNTASGDGVGRTEWTQADYELLQSDERALVITYHFIKRAPRSIARTSELFELWLRRSETVDDYNGSIFLPSRTGLTRGAFVQVWAELARRVRSGELSVSDDTLSRYPDILSYAPRE